MVLEGEIMRATAHNLILVQKLQIRGRLHKLLLTRATSSLMPVGFANTWASLIFVQLAPSLLLFLLLIRFGSWTD